MNAEPKVAVCPSCLFAFDPEDPDRELAGKKQSNSAGLQAEAAASILNSIDLAEAERAVLYTLQEGVRAGTITRAKTTPEIRDVLYFTMNHVISQLFEKVPLILARCDPEYYKHIAAHFVAGALVSVGYYDELVDAYIDTYAKENGKCMPN